MSALRINVGGPVRLIDLGPGTALGHVHDGGRLCRPDSTPEREPREVVHDEGKRAVWAAASRRYRERKRGAAA